MKGVSELLELAYPADRYRIPHQSPTVPPETLAALPVTVIRWRLWVWRMFV